jgi:hypothetical protein
MERKERSCGQREKVCLRSDGENLSQDWVVERM